MQPYFPRNWDDNLSRALDLFNEHNSGQIFHQMKGAYRIRPLISPMIAITKSDLMSLTCYRKHAVTILVDEAFPSFCDPS